jgi:uncharacterized protein YndB with AHSA1/START domain
VATEALSSSRTVARGSAILAEAEVDAPADEVFSFLASLENHWLLAGRFVEVLELERPAPGRPAHGGRVRMHGPFGLRRDATTRVVDVEPPIRIAGTAEVDGGTRARVSWTVTPAAQATRVRLEAKIENSTPLDRIVLSLGGAAWMRRRFAEILAVLAKRWGFRG